MAGSIPFIRLLTDTGNNAGNWQMNVNGSVTPKLFYLQAVAGQRWVITHLHVTIACSSQPLMNDYGNITNGLTNGLAVQSKAAGVISNPLGSFTFKKNFHWGIFGQNGVQISTFSGQPQTLTTDIQFIETDTSGVGMDGNQGDYYGFLVQDNLSTLTAFKIAAYGERYAI